MPIVPSRNPLPYQHRRGLLPTPNTAGRIHPGGNAANALPLARPYPAPELLLPVRMPSNPDSGRVQPWPGQVP